MIDRDTRQIIGAYLRKYREYKGWYESLEDKTEAADSLKLLVIQAIDEGFFWLGAEQPEDTREEYCKVIHASCAEPRRFNYEAVAKRFPYSRAELYRRKNKFLQTIKDEIGL